MKLAYITVRAPLGPSEAHLIPEMQELLKHSELLIVPLRPGKSIYSHEGDSLKSHCLRVPLLNIAVLVNFLLFWVAHPWSGWKLLATLIRHSRSLPILIKNLVVFPKGIYLAKLFSRQKVDHIHAHWGSTTATCTYIAARLSNIPWSLTLHSWDIEEDNMLQKKVASCRFVRTISEDGRKRALRIVGDELDYKIHMIHMGVRIPGNHVTSAAIPTVPTIGCVARLAEVKGHRHLLQACSLLRRRGVDVKCVLIGGGSELKSIQGYVHDLGLEDRVDFRGRMRHEEVLQLLSTHSIQVSVLASVTTEDGQTEGIPVALMEAMAHKVPAVATSIGGIPELVGDGAGWLVPQKDAEALAEAIQSVLENPGPAADTVDVGFEKVRREFNVEINARQLYGLIVCHCGKS